jgi:hypothetical protein
MSLADERAGLGRNPDQRLPSCCLRSPWRLGTTHESRRPGRLLSACSRDFIEPTTFRLRVGCSASIWMAPDGSSLLTLDASWLQTAPDGYRLIVWMIIGMIKAHPTSYRMARQANGILLARAQDGCTCLRWSPLRERLAYPTGKQTEDAALPSSQDEAAPMSARYR